MRGRGRGRGRGGFTAISFKKVPFKPIDTYPYNPNCELTPALTEVEKELIVFNRLLKRYANESEDYTREHVEQKLVNSYENQFEVGFKDPDAQRRLIVEGVGPEYFPAELLGAALNPSLQKLGASKKSINWALLESKGGAEEETARGDGVFDEEENAEEEEDFGGDDYGADHYGEEDREDEFQDDGGNDFDE
ncbi:hypothetical protein GNI_134200 [Gregarina niphandrodes]|uniref:DNA-directed RNA polymerase III subunit n=1 Tax=Gregarina niphandrodes TaxID=110365 RepID=A0A023B1M9_GRENI|nr:hypothetical protein GNI_134200 [Gregarina niphandrodes]EZG46246.1 hypothetical protein GNI_134200 [Gregarina niphandrodes]|eukprot:XP_011132316.1 hypothetical protein GNI_134200 [Gregarina niphandrodes]